MYHIKIKQIYKLRVISESPHNFHKFKSRLIQDLRNNTLDPFEIIEYLLVI
jgi:hypothetical protein